MIVLSSSNQEKIVKFYLTKNVSFLLSHLEGIIYIFKKVWVLMYLYLYTWKQLYKGGKQMCLYIYISIDIDINIYIYLCLYLCLSICGVLRPLWHSPADWLLRHLHTEPDGFGSVPKEENSLSLEVLGRKMVYTGAPGRLLSRHILKNGNGISLEWVTADWVSWAPFLWELCGIWGHVC